MMGNSGGRCKGLVIYYWLRLGGGGHGMKA